MKKIKFKSIKVESVFLLILSMIFQGCMKETMIQEKEGHKLSLRSNENERIKLDIKDFGAWGDGQTDDSQAVLNAFAYINANPDSLYVLKFPNGVYPMNVQVIANNLHIKGEGTLVRAGQTDVVLKISGDNNTIRELSFVEEENKYCHVLLEVEGDNNWVKDCHFERYERVETQAVYYSDKFLHLSKNQGTGNIIKDCSFKNGRTGIGIRGSCKVLDSEISNCVTGIMAHSSTRNTEIAGNLIRDNNVNNASGADGILAVRNVSGLHIHDNTITTSGEHGMYFQGDNSIIEDNEVYDNYRSGIKLASYNTGLYNHPDTGYYIGFNNIVRNNTCYGNGSGQANAGIYLQAPLKDIVVDNNICYDNPHGIRSTSVYSISPDDEYYDEKTTLKRIYISHNTVYNNSPGRSLYVEGETNIYIENNETDVILTNAKSVSHKIDGAVIYGNIVRGRLIPNRAVNTVIRNNDINELFVNSNSTSDPDDIKWNRIVTSNVPVDSSNVFVDFEDLFNN